MTKNRKYDAFTGENYRDILLKKLRDIYSGCVPCVHRHYLRHPEKTLSTEASDESYFEGNVYMYCSHQNCCGCCCEIKVSLYSLQNYVEARYKVSGKRSHKPKCTRSRPVSGKYRGRLREKWKTSSGTKLYRELLDQCTDQERCLGSLTYLPSQSVLRNIKSNGHKAIRYTNSWFLNLKLFRKRLDNSRQTFVRHIAVYPPAVHLYTNAQIKLFNDVADKDVVYFDATESLLRRQPHCKDYQIYTLLVRNPVEGGVSLPVASNVTTSHDGASISHFLESFLIDQIKECKTAKKRALMIIDASFVMWNAVLKAMCRESRLDYYNRCFRIVIGKPSILTF